ncbi:MAG TPA: NIPSNAP family protein [Bryobacteraceae bacterium]|nr:NIPSNAP family protein [Bryobacteraceae bacterium]
MTRRKFVPALAAGGALAAQGEDKAPSIYEIRTIRLRNTPDNQRARLTDFLEHAAMPAFARAGIGPCAYFASMIAEETPFIMSIASYPSLGGMEQMRAKLSADAEYKKALTAYNSQPGLNYERIDSFLGRAFPSVPDMIVPNDAAGRPGRVFELRRYESNNATTLARKIKMFESGEIAIFRRLGMRPVFFAETIVGEKMPNLVYMLSYDDLATRERMWKAFGSDPDWQKLRSTPGYSDAEIVSNISVTMLQPLPFSPVR